MEKIMRRFNYRKILMTLMSSLFVYAAAFSSASAEPCKIPEVLLMDSTVMKAVKTAQQEGVSPKLKSADLARAQSKLLGTMTVSEGLFTLKGKVGKVYHPTSPPDSHFQHEECFGVSDTPSLSPKVKHFQAVYCGVTSNWDNRVYPAKKDCLFNNLYWIENAKIHGENHKAKILVTKWEDDIVGGVFDEYEIWLSDPNAVLDHPGHGRVR
jgi:hypothetical protein